MTSQESRKYIQILDSGIFCSRKAEYVGAQFTVTWPGNCLATAFVRGWVVDHPQRQLTRTKAIAPYPRAARAHGHPRTPKPAFAPMPRVGRAPDQVPARS